MHTICSSRVSHVTVHARGAWVTRALVVPGDLPDEDVELVVPEITPLADPGSVRAIVRGGRRVVSVQTALAIPETPAAPGDTAARVRGLGRALERQEAERDRLVAERQALAALELDPRLRASARRPDGGAVDARVADGLATSSLVTDVLAGIDARLA